MPNKLIVFCDSPLNQSGFARVAQNLLSRWQASGFFEQIWVWGIGYQGFPHKLPYQICPAATIASPQWSSAENLQRFMYFLSTENVGGTAGGFSHVWLMHDTWNFSPLAEALQEQCDHSGQKTFLYFPVDAPLEPEWTDIIAAVDHPVAYCDYGRKEAEKALVQSKKKRFKTIQKLAVIPHGVDTSIYRPIEESDGLSIEDLRHKMFGGRVQKSDLLICVVSQLQKRKGHHLALQVLKELRAISPELNAKMYLHMSATEPREGLDLERMIRGLGLSLNQEVFLSAPDMFHKGHALRTEKELNIIYNVSDVLLTTSYGEGWGLTVTEAMAAGLPVVAPNHTSLADILGATLPDDEQRGMLFNTEGFEVLPFDNSRVRPRPDPGAAAMAISIGAVHSRCTDSFEGYRRRALDWVRGDQLSWDVIAQQWLEIFE